MKNCNIQFVFFISIAKLQRRFHISKRKDKKIDSNIQMRKLYIEAQYVLQLVDPDDNDIIVYEVPMPAGVNSVMLPSWIAGDYVIQLLWNGWRFWGYIELE